MIKYFIPHIVFFSVFCAALVPVLFYYQRRNPHARFRPGVGEMTMITVFSLLIGAGLCYFLGNMFRGDQNFNQYNGAPNEGAGWSRGTSAPQEPARGSRYP